MGASWLHGTACALSQASYDTAQISVTEITQRERERERMQFSFSLYIQALMRERQRVKRREQFTQGRVKL
jgi:hypothetical protein